MRLSFLLILFLGYSLPGLVMADQSIAESPTTNPESVLYGTDLANLRGTACYGTYYYFSPIAAQWDVGQCTGKNCMGYSLYSGVGKQNFCAFATCEKMAENSPVKSVLTKSKDGYAINRVAKGLHVSEKIGKHSYKLSFLDQNGAPAFADVTLANGKITEYKLYDDHLNTAEACSEKLGVAAPSSQVSGAGNANEEAAAK